MTDRPTLFSHPARGIPWLAWALAVGFLGLALGSYLHESDQASLLAGAWQLKTGAVGLDGLGLYNYDKQYGTYWIMAGLFRVLPGVDLVWLGNVASFGAFWLALAFFLRRRPARTLVQAASLAACILAPAFLQHSAFLASNYWSGALVLVAAGLGRGRLALLILAAGVACRVDALFILPAVAWTQTVRSRGWALVRSRQILSVAAVGLATFLAGRVLAAGASRDVYTLFFQPKVYLAFVVFGLGAAGFPALAWAGATLRASQRRGYGIFYALGAAALLPALAYYSVQMFSTRHWTVWLVGLIVLLSGRRAAALLAGLAKPVRAGLLVASLGGALLPLVVGLHLPRPTEPHLQWAAGTRFPTADGNLTMGGYGWALRDVGRMNGFVDHNQAIWRAARSTEYVADPNGIVPVVATPMLSYYQLALVLRGQVARTQAEPSPGAYLDSRSWLRPAVHLDQGIVGKSNARTPWPVQSVSPVYAGVRMLRFESGGRLGAAEAEDFFVQAVFAGNEFVRLPAGAEANAQEYEGRTLAWWAAQPFALELVDGNGAVESRAAEAKEGVYLVVLTGGERAHKSFRVSPGVVRPQVAAAVLMDYMRIEGIRRGP